MGFDQEKADQLGLDASECAWLEEAFALKLTWDDVAARARDHRWPSGWEDLYPRSLGGGTANASSAWTRDGRSPSDGPSAEEAVDLGDRYEWIGDQRGEGGQGIVRCARDRWLGREVAVKVPRFEKSDDARVEREVRALAALNHPVFIPVFDVGRTSRGTLYFTMPWAPGKKTLAGEIDALPKQPSRTLPAFRRIVSDIAEVCEGMGFAHRKDVLHRDLTPDNMLRGEAGNLLVADFGIARVGEARERARDDGAGVPGQTTRGGKPGYAPDEQLDPQASVTPQSDVYSLGATLYAAARARVEVPARHEWNGRGIDPELWSIIQRASAKEPAARYEHAGVLGDDVRRWLDGELVAVHPYTPAEHLTRFVRRNALLVVSVVLLGGLAVALFVWGRAALATARVEEASRLVLRARLAYDRGAFAEAGGLAAEALALGERADARGLALGAARPRVLEPLGTYVLTRSDAEDTTYCRTVAWSADSSAFYCAGMEHGLVRVPVEALPKGIPDTSFCDKPLGVGDDTEVGERVVQGAAYSVAVNGPLVAAGMKDGTVVVFREDPYGTDLRSWSVTPGASIETVVWTGSEELVVGGEGKQLWRIDLGSPDPSPLGPRPGPGALWNSESVGAGKVVVTGSDVPVGVWDARVGGPPLHLPDLIQAHALGVDRRGRMYLGGPDQRGVRVYSPQDSVPSGWWLTDLLPTHEGGSWDIDVSPDSQLMAVATARGAVVLRELPGGRRVHEEIHHCDDAFRVAFSPDGTRLLSSGWDARVRVWRVSVGEARVASSAFVESLAFDASGGLWLGDVAGSWRYWPKDKAPWGEWQAAPGVAGPTRFDFDTDRNVALAVSETGEVMTVRLVVTPNGPSVDPDSTFPRLDKVRPYRGRVSPNGKLVAVGGLGDGLVVYEIEGTVERCRVQLPEGPEHWSVGVDWRDNTSLVFVTKSGGVATVDADRADGERRCGIVEQVGVGGDPRAVHAAPSGRVWTVTTQGSVVATERGRVVVTRLLGLDMLTALAVSDAEDLVAVGTDAGRVVLLAAPHWQVVAEWGAHDSRISVMAFDDAGRTLATGSWDRTAQRWDLSGLPGRTP